MAYMSLDEWRKQKETGSTQGTSKSSAAPTASTSGGTTAKTSGYMSLDEWRSMKAKESAEWWSNAAIALVRDTNNYHSKWHSKDDESYTSLYNRTNDLLAVADYWRKQYAGNDEAIASIDSIVDALGDSIETSGKARSFYAQWDTEDAYLKWDSYSTTEKRQATYQQNQTRLQELKDRRDQIKQKNTPTQTYSSGIQHTEASTGMLTSYGPDGAFALDGSTGMQYGAESTGMPYGVASLNLSDEDRAELEEIEKEISKIQSEMEMYERGNTDESGFYYGSKVVDDYSKFQSNPNFGKFSATDFTNPTSEDMKYYDAMMDQSTWYLDGSGNTRNRLGDIVTYSVDADDSKYQIADPLGMYLQATPEDLATMYGDGSTQLGVLNRLYLQGSSGNWEQLTEGEVGIYYTLLGTKGKDAAMQYLTDMTTELNRRNMAADTERYNQEFAEAGDLMRIAMSMASVPAQVLGGGAAFLDDLGHVIRGEDINPYSSAHAMSNYANIVRSNQAKAWDEATGYAAIPFINFTVGDLYKAGMSTLDMGFGSLLGANAYGVLMGMGASSSEAQRLYEMGASNEQIIWGAALAGASEMLAEKYSIESLINLKDAETVGQFVLNALVQGGIEASEEGVTELANTITNAIVMGDQSDWAKLLEEHNGDYVAAVKAKAQDIGKAAFSGFISGGMGGTGSSAITYSQTSAQNKALGEYISKSNTTNDLMELAKEMAGGASGKAQSNLTKQSERLGKDFLTEGGKNKAIGRLYKTVRSVVTEQNIKDISTALQEKGISKKDATAIAGAVAVQANGMKLTEDQQKVLEKFESNADVQETVSAILDNKESGINQRARSVAKFEFNTLRNQIASSKKQEAPGQENKTSEGNLTDGDKASAESHYEVSAEGKTILKSTGEIVNVKEVANIKDGRMTLMLEDGNTVDSEDVSYSSEAEALVYETVARMDITAKSANILVNGFKATQVDTLSATEYAHEIEEAFRYGELGIPASGLASSSFAHKLTPAVQDFVYRQGKKAAGKQVARAQATVKKSVQAALASEKSEVSENSYSAILDDGIDVMDLNESQKASIRLADHIAQAAKVNIRVYAGKTGEHGYYDPNTDEVYLNLNATNASKKSMMAFTLGHELVHRAKKGSPAKYKAFANFLMEQYGKQGANVEAMIAEELAAAKEFKIKMTYEQAFEEVVCDACQRMLLDTNAGQKLAEFGAQSKQNKSFLEDLKRWISEFMEKLRSIFVDVDPDSLAAKEFAKFDANVKQILADMYVDMTIDAGENLSTIKNAFGKGTVVKANENGEFTMAQSADGSQKVFNLVTWKNGGRETLEATLLREGYTEDEVKAALTIMDENQRMVENIANELDDNGRLAFPEQGRINEATLTTDLKDGHSVLSALVSNGDYPVNIDLLMVCKKRKAYQRVINRLCETGMIQQATVDALAIAEINKILGKYGFETACLGCFVESRRLRIQEWAQTIVKEWNAEVKKRNPNAKSFGFGKGEATLTPDEVMKLIGELESGGKKNDQGNLNLGQGSAVKRMGVLLDKVPSLRRTLSVEDLITPDGLSSLRRFDSNLFSMVKSRYGSNSPKFVQEFNPYNHDLAKYGMVPTQYESLREYLYAIGGARMQSFSDFIIENWFDYCQIVADLAARKLPMHTYTKEISLARLFGLTGIKINMSLIPDVDRSLPREYAGLTRNAKGELELIWADKDRFKATGGKSYMQSINFKDAVDLQNDPRYSANVGTIAVGISDMHIRMMLNDPRIRMVIPYHSSGMNPIFADMMGTSYYKDYTNFQNTTVKQLNDSNGKPVSLKLDKTQVGKLTSGFLFNEVLQNLGDARAAAEAYKEWCADASLHTITIKGETYTAELTPKFDDFKDETNYYKLLEDFNTYDCITENAAPQGDVQQIYPENFEKILKDELKAQEGHRQKQEKDQAFDKAMGEIESYLKNHTKADTVYYAQQHGIKLGAKDQKLNAADKAKLKQLQEEGASFSLPKGDTATAFHNHMERIISGLKQDKIYADSVVSLLRGKGLEDQEIGWSGIEAWLEGKTYVTKIDLLRFAASCFVRDNVSGKVYDIRYNEALRHRDLVEIGDMPSLYNKLFGFTGKVYVSNDHLYQNMVSKADAIAEGRPPQKAGADYHELGEEKVINAIMCFQNPIAIMESLNDFNEPRLVSIIDEKGADGNNLLAVLELYTDKTAYGVSQERNHVLFTIYEKSSLPDYVKATAEKNRILYIRKGASSDTEASLQLAGAISKETLTNNLALFNKKVNAFREKENIDYKLPVGEDTSPRALLSNAFETIVTNPIEKQKLQEYKEKVSMLNKEEAKLQEIRAQIKELSFAKGKRDTKKITELRFDANQTANRIATLDKMLLRFEASAPLQNILQREKDMVRKRERHRSDEALAAYRKAERERNDKRFNEVKEKYKESRKQVIETRDKRDATAKLQKLVLDTVKWISYPSKTDVKCPDILKAPYADFLKGIDISSKRMADGGDPTMNDLRLATAMDSLATALDRIMASQDPNQDSNNVLDTGYLDLPAGFVKQLRNVTENVKAMMVEGDYVVNTMSAAEVRELSKIIRTLNHAIKEVSTLYATMRFVNAEMLGDDTISFMEELGELENTSKNKDFVAWENALPYYAFKRFGNGGEAIFEGFMDAQDKLAFLAKQIFEFQEKTWNGDEAKAWSEDTHTVELPDNGEIKLTTADAMSIYCLSRRQQGMQHLLGGGIRVVGIQKGSQKAKDSRSLLTIKDINAINSSLTDRQRKVAEAIQEFMSTVCAEWGNEISMKRFLTRDFTEKFYFPIESNDENLSTKDPAAQQSDLFRLLNISATKALDPNANNEVIIRNVFDVFTGHASDMARLNTYGLPLLDCMKWLNYREKTVNAVGQPTVRGVRKAMKKAYGDAANSYVLNLIKDVNGRVSDGGDPSILMKWMRAAKTASVGSSLRVATLQITSYPRAALVLSPRNLALGLSKMPNIEKAKKYCGIALWKSFGFYDTNISRSIEDQMKGVKDVRQKLIELSLLGAEWGDAITWGALWNACEYEVAATKKYKVGSEEFNQAVGKKLREVVYRTQVVDSTLTRSQIMRSKRGMAQEAAAFMSEPTLSANILMDAGFEFNLEKRRTGSAKAAWEKTSKYISRAVAVYAIGQLTAALLEGFWDAWRDDDDEEFWKKYIDAFVENLVLDLVPFNKIPIVSDLFDAALSMFDIGFYSSERMSTTWLTQAVSAVDAWKKVFGGESSATVYNAMYKSVRALSSFYGVSFSGVMREGVALWNNTVGAYDITMKIRQYELTKDELGLELYDAILNGDTRQAESLKAQFEDEKAIQSAMRGAIKVRYLSGEIDKTTALKYLVLYGGKDAGDALWVVEEWDYNNTKTGDEDYKKYAEFYSAVETGKNLKAVIKKYIDNGVEPETLRSQITDHFKPIYVEMTVAERANIKGYLINAFEACGSKRWNAEDTLKEWDFEAKHGQSYEEMVEAYKSGEMTRSAMMAILKERGLNEDEAEKKLDDYDLSVKYGIDYSDREKAYANGEITLDQLRQMYQDKGKTEEEIEMLLEAHQWLKNHPDVDRYASEVVSYIKPLEDLDYSIEDTGMDIETFIRERAEVGKFEGDPDGKGGWIYNSRIKKAFPYINSLDLTPAQKTALAVSCGWSLKTVQKNKLW